METAEKLRRTITKDKDESRFSDGTGALSVVPTGDAKNRSTNNDAFVSLLEQTEKKINSLSRSKVQSAALYAEELCSILRELLRNLTGTLVVSDALAVLAGDYWADSAIIRLVENIERDALKATHSLLPLVRKSEEYHFPQQIARMRFFLEWLRRRQATLCFFEERSIYEVSAVAIRSVLHDRERLGVSGFEVRVSARLDGFEYQALWLRLQLYADAEPVLVKPEWGLWQEDTELFLTSQDSPRDQSPPRFTTVNPILPRQQRLFIDSTHLFVPYAALDIVASRRTEIEIEVVLLSESGLSLSADATTEFCAVPPLSKDSPLMPSSLSLGFWPHNLGTADMIRHLVATPTSAIIANREVHSVRVSADLELFNREGDAIVLEVRFLTRAGHLIESELEGYRGQSGAFIYSQKIYPASVCEHYSPLQISIPLVALELDPGTIELFVEVTILAANREIICGDLALVELVIPDIIRMQAGALVNTPEHSIDAVMTLGAIVIDSTYRMNGRDAVRIEVLLADSATHHETCQLRLKIVANQAAKGQVFESIVRGLVVERGSDSDEKSFVFVIDGEEFMPGHPDGLRELSFTAMINLFDSRGLSKISTQRSFTLASGFASECATWLESSYVSQGVEIIDAQTRCTPLRGGEVLIDLAINCEYSLPCHKPYPIYFEPLQKINNTRGKALDKIDGSVVELTFSSASREGLGASGERQLRQQVRLPKVFQSQEYADLKMMLFSPEGRLLQVLHVPLRPHKIGN